MMKMKRIFVLVAFSLAWLAASAQEAGVRAWKGTLEMPSYIGSPAEVAPIFERDWSYQRARRSVYPYVLDDNMYVVDGNMERQKENRTYEALYLENEYVKLCVLPEIGGRLFYAVDKTNGYDIFYHNEVVKPANVGMLGSWISGGVEWNVFHHHRNTTNMSVDCRIVENADGSATIWVGEVEFRHRMQWAIGITLRPGKSYIEVDGRLINSTADDNSFLYWSNVSTKVDENYQIIFPQSVDFVTFHCKNWFAHWPVTHEPFNDMQFYRNDVDASWWKNHFMSNSMFAYDLKEDFIAGYDHGAGAGTMITGNHHINKGGKFWLWGPNSMWDTKILTDSSGHYIELMMGAYSDNQPDYNWNRPYEVKKFTQYFYGIRDIGGVKAGNNLAAMNFEPQGKGRYLIGINTTEARSGMTVKLTAGGRVLWEKVLDVSPDRPFVGEVKVDGGLAPYEITASLITDGETILSYTPRKDTGYDRPLPEIVERPLRPHEIENNEECYFVGLRNLQFHNPFVNPADYFLEVLRRDPGDTRANTQMGVMLRRNGEYEKAAAYLRRAIRRQTHDYTRPADCEAMYNLGLVLKAQGRYAEAMDTLYRATWNFSYSSPANYQLAQMYSQVKDYRNALMRADEAVRNNGSNWNALNLKASILHAEGRSGEAAAILRSILEEDPLNIYSTYELDLIDGTSGHVELMGGEVEDYIELALQYLHNGFRDIAVDILEEIDAVRPYPTVKMWLGYLNDDRAMYEAALEMPVDYCNPFRLETIPVLEKAKEICPSSDKPYYYLGCLLYNRQQDAAAQQWRRCVAINPRMDLAWRNLGWYNWLYTKDYDEAAECYARAVEINPDSALYLEEQEHVLEAKGESVQKRYDILKSHHATAVRRYYPLAQEVVTGTFTGDYDYVLGLLENCYFPTREGVASFHEVYVDALLCAGYEKFLEGDCKGAVALYEKSFSYPANHQVFLVDERSPRDAQTYCFMAEAYAKAGMSSKAKSCYRKASEVDTKSSFCRYWKALAMERLGRKPEAVAIYKAMADEGRAAVVEDIVSFYGAEGTSSLTVEGINTMAYRMMGLGYLGLGDREQAHECFSKALDLKNDNLWAKFMMKQTASCSTGLHITPFERLNQGGAVLNSHKGATARSTVKPMGSSLHYVPADVTVSPAYPRIRVLPDGSYILFWQEKLSPGDGNGRHTLYAKSVDLEHWTPCGYLFEGGEVINGRGEKDTRVFTNANAIVLSDGELLACSSYRNIRTYPSIDHKQDHGIVIKKSKDGGLTWYGEKVIYHGPNWEAHLMELPSGELQCYFSESRPWVSWSHSGTSMVYSRDGGETWEPSLDSKPLRVMRKKWWCEDLGRYLLTDQMPVGIRLNGTDQLAFAMETVTGRVNRKQSFSTSIVFSQEDGTWIPVEDEEESESMTYRLDNVDRGANAAGPYLLQLPSGETVLYVTTRGRIYTMVGDETAHNWSGISQRPVLPGWAGWPGGEVESSHTLLAVAPQRNVRNENTVGIIRLALNHDIAATGRKVRTDGRSREWKDTDEALYLGEFSDASATIRSSADRENVYFLVEVADTSLSGDDYVALMLSDPVSRIEVKLSYSGLVSAMKDGHHVDGIAAGAVSEGTADDSSDRDTGYAVEVSVPRSLLDIREGFISLNAVLYDNDAGKEEYLMEPSSSDGVHIIGL